MEVTNRRWNKDEFLLRRREVLAEWPTGKEAEDLYDYSSDSDEDDNLQLHVNGKNAI